LLTLSSFPQVLGGSILSYHTLSSFIPPQWSPPTSETLTHLPIIPPPLKKTTPQIHGPILSLPILPGGYRSSITTKIGFHAGECPLPFRLVRFFLLLGRSPGLGCIFIFSSPSSVLSICNLHSGIRPPYSHLHIVDSPPTSSA